jgi:hypothetical protein
MAATQPTVVGPTGYKNYLSQILLRRRPERATHSSLGQPPRAIPERTELHMRWSEPLASICCTLHWACLKKKTKYGVKNVPFPIRTRNLHRHHHGPWPRPCICCQRQKETARVKIRTCRLKSQRQGGKWSSHGRICKNIRMVVGVKEMSLQTS